jgi:hypothetical protein
VYYSALIFNPRDSGNSLTLGQVATINLQPDDICKPETRISETKSMEADRLERRTGYDGNTCVPCLDAEVSGHSAKIRSCYSSPILLRLAGSGDMTTMLACGVALRAPLWATIRIRGVMAVSKAKVYERHFGTRVSSLESRPSYALFLEIIWG